MPTLALNEVLDFSPEHGSTVVALDDALTALAVIDNSLGHVEAGAVRRLCRRRFSAHRPAIVLDSFGNPLSNPLILSDSGDFANPQTTATPEPSSVFLLTGGLVSLLLFRKWSRSRRVA